jgi:hypothetical protein
MAPIVRRGGVPALALDQQTGWPAAKAGTRPARYRRPMAIRVECYAGYRGEQEPTAFWLGSRRLAVRAIVDRWFAPAQRWFRVDADDGNLYVLRHDDQQGEWDVAAFTRSPG